MARALIHAPKSVRAGEIVEIRLLVGHPMETGHRADGMGGVLPRNIIRRLECRYDGALVFAADLYPAITANPYFSFPLRITAAGTLHAHWRGDNGFAHAESVRIALA